eukprot:scaffold489_cov105-Skeletonema_marinoi.AAC.4
MPYSQREIRYGARVALAAVPKRPHQVIYDVAGRRYDQQILEPCVRYDKAVNRGRGAGGRPKFGLIRSPTVRRRSDNDTSNKCLSRDKDASILSWPTIMGHIHSVR